MPRNPKVDAFFAALDHPRRAELAALRDIILAADTAIEEDIKWQCPTFSYKGTLASLVVRTKKVAQVMSTMAPVWPIPARCSSARAKPCAWPTSPRLRTLRRAGGICSR
ncbi:MAG: DUF1801 domain-containing protein [Alphaproteobacteria bacterium]|nr:DUF1801 domain-containing protein [Alphaproteobacteria bacterium]